MMLPLLLCAVQSFAGPLMPSSAPSTSSAQAATCQASWIPTFGPTDSLDGLVSNAVVFDDGTGASLYVGGGFHSSGPTQLNSVARWTGAGFAALGAGLPGSSSNNLQALTVFDDGGGAQLFAGGRFHTGGGLARWNGAAWVVVGGGLSLANPQYPGDVPWVNTCEVYDDGSGAKLYVTGYFTLAGGAPVSGFATWNGAAWAASPPPPASGMDMIVFDAGAGPELYSSGFGGVWRTGPAGGWNDVSNGVEYLTRLCVFDAGSGPELYGIGQFPPFGEKDVARWNGASWTRLAGGFQSVNAIAGHDDGSGPRLYVQGTSAGSAVIKAWDGVSWQTQPGALNQPTGNPGVALVLQSFDDGAGDKLFVAGGFGTAGGVPAGNFARFDGSTWDGGRPGVDGQVWAIERFDDGGGEALFVGGIFSSIDGVPRRSIARWDGADWSSVGAGFTSGRVTALATYDDGTGRALYAGGNFVAGPDAGNRIARWDGQSWTPLGSGLTGGSFPQVFAMKEFDDGSGNALFVGGQFTTAGGVSSTGIAKWDGTTWSTVGGGISASAQPSVRAFEVFDDGSGPALYVGGWFTTAGGNPIECIARWDGTSFTALTPGQTLGPVQALQVYDDGAGERLYASGYFTQIAGFATNSIARWDGAAWSALAPIPACDIRALEVFDDGTGDALFVAGIGINGTGVPAMLARWNGAWSTVAPGSQVSGSMGLALAVFDDGATNALHLGGAFQASPSGDRYLARYGCPSDSHVSSFCAGDGSGAACPCGNDGAAGNGCANSANVAGASLAWSGGASVLDEDLTLLGSGMPPTATCIYLQGTTETAGGIGVVFGDGLRCVAGSLIRLGVESNVGGASSYPGPGDPSIVVRGLIPPGGGVTRTYQCWYRDPASFCTTDVFNITSGLRVDWQP